MVVYEVVYNHRLALAATLHHHDVWSIGSNTVHHDHNCFQSTTPAIYLVTRFMKEGTRGDMLPHSQSG